MSVTYSGSLAQSPPIRIAPSGASNVLTLVSSPSVGDRLVVAYSSFASTDPQITGVTGGGVTTWTSSGHHAISAGNGNVEVWTGVVTSTGVTAVTVTTSVSASGRMWLLDTTGVDASQTVTAVYVAGVAGTAPIGAAGAGGFAISVAIAQSGVTAAPTPGWTSDVTASFAALAYGPIVTSPLTGSWVGGSGAVATLTIALAAAPAPTATVQIDASGTAFGGSPTWTDVTSYAMTSDKEAGSAPIQFTWGRQAWLGDVSPSTFSLTFRNIDGRFTPSRQKLADNTTANPLYPNFKYGTRIRYTETVAGVVIFVVDGYLTDVTAMPANGTYWTVAVNAVDILGRMGSTMPLRGWLTEEMLLDAPACLYMLQEGEGSTSFGDVTGNLAPAVIVNSKYGRGVVEAGQSAPGNFTAGTTISIANSAYPSSLASGAAGSSLRLPNPIPASGAFSISCWFLSPPSPPGGANGVFIAGVPTPLVGSTGFYAKLEMGAAGTIAWVVGVQLSSLGFISAANGTTNICDGQMHHLVGELAADNKTLTLFVDGVQVATTTAGSAFGSQTSTVPFSVGMDGTNLALPMSGAVAYVACFPVALAGGRVLAHFNAGVNAFEGIDRTDQHVARILSYRPNTGSVLDVGLGMTGSEDCTGQAESQALLDCSAAEGGVLYADGQGRIVLRSRAVNFNPAPVLVLDASLGAVDIPTTFANTLQGVANDITVSVPNGTDQRALNQASIAALGDIVQSVSPNVDTDQHALDIANWLVAQGIRDQTGIPTLTVNLFALKSSATAIAVLMLRSLDCVTVINIPGVPPSSTMTGQVQGGSLIRSSEGLSVGLYCTPIPTLVVTADPTSAQIAAGDTADSAIYSAAY